jgi:arginine/lysine/histidine/glutamine transport system substrate-binding/permease protein
MQLKLRGEMIKFGFRRWLCWFLVVGLSSCLLAGCSVNPSGRKTLRLASEPAFPPVEFQGKGGELEAFSIDLMRAITTAASFQVEFQS